MRKLCLLLLTVCFATFVNAQIPVTVTGNTNTTPNLQATYTSVALAIADLNLVTSMTGPVVFDLAAGSTESNASQLTITTAGNASFPITFQKSGAGANPILTRTDAGTNTTSAIGGLGDGIIRIEGTDNLVFNGLDLAASNQGIEYGYYTHKPSGTDACQGLTIQNCNITMSKGTSGFVVGIYIGNGSISVSSATGVTVTANSGRTENVTIRGNSISNVHAGIVCRGSSAATFYDQNFIIGQSGAGNTIQNFGGGSATTTYGVYFIYTNNVNADYNTINNAGGGGSAHASTFYGIFYSTVTGVISGSNNSFTVNSSGTSAVQMIYNGNAVTSNTFSNNTFAGTIAATSTSYLIYASSATPDVTISGNQTSGTFTKTGTSGTLYCYYNLGSPASGTETITNNNFSNLSTTGTSGTSGIYTNTAVGQNRVCSGNTINNWTVGSGTTYGIYCLSSLSNQVFNNTVSNITGTTNSTFIGLYFSGTNPTVYGNTVFALSNAGTQVSGIQSAGTGTVNLYKNKVYGLSCTSTGTTAGLVNGIIVTTIGTATNIYNNLIGNLSASAATGGDAVRGISFTGTTSSTTINLSFNTINLTGAGGTGFGSSGIFHTYSATATSASLVMKNNIIVNGTTPSGAGLAVAFRRSASTSLANYNTASNNNLFYAGTPGAANLLYYDGTNADQTIGALKARLTPGESVSVSENPNFVSTTGSDPTYLHINTGIATQIESGGATIGGITDDYDGDTRNVSTPDIGADEFAGIGVDLSAPTITYTPLGNTCTLTGVTLTATITDASGVPTAGIGLPVLYWRINAGSYNAATGVSLGSNQYQFTFGAGVVLADVVSYYIVAQDNAGTPNVGAFPSAGAGGFTANPPAAATPPSTPSSYTIQANLSGTYTVGAGGAYTTITAAVAAYNTSCLTGPVIFSLTDATYPGETYPIVINPNSYASSTNTLTIKPAVGVTTTISGSLADGFLFRVYGNYVIFDGSNAVSGTTRDLTITNTNVTSPSAVLYGSVSPNPNVGGTIKNVIFINGSTGTSNVVLGSSTSTTGSAVAGLSNNFTFQNNSSRTTNFGLFVIQTSSAGNGSGMLITGNDLTTGIVNAGISVQGVDGVTISNNTISGIDPATTEVDYGIRLRTGTINATVSNNTISNLGFTGATTGNAYGIWVESANATSSVTVSGNTITDFTSSGTATISTTGIYVSGATAGVTIEKNIIRNIKQTNTTGYGASGIQLSSTSATANISVRNNMISDIAAYGKATAGVADNGYGIVVSNGAGYGIYYNSIHLNTNQTLVGGLPAAINITSGVSAAGAIDLRNNIFANSQTIGTERYAIYSGAANTVFSNIDYNDYYSAGPNLGFIVSNRATLADIQTGFGGNTNSENVQPSFVSSTDLHLTPGGNSNLDGDATPIGGITADIDNDARDGTTPDIGADEFTGILGVDMGATALVAPAASGCYTAAETVTVTIRNFGASTIDFAVDNVTVTVTATGGYNQNVILNSGTLAAGATQNVSMPATINMSANGVYTFNANTSVAGDITPGNDAMTPVNRTVLTLGGTYTVGAGGNYTNLTAAVADYNAANCFTGPVFFELTSTYTSAGETFPISINANAAAGTNYLTIRPASGQNPLITGSVAAGSIIKLNGADYVIIDGSNNGSNSRNLTIQNTTTTTSGNAVVWLASPAVSNGASNNIIRNCIIEGNSSTTSFTGIHVGGSTTIGLTTAGLDLNNANTISNNLLRKSIYGVTMFGISTTTPDQNNVISNNNFGTAVTGEGFSLLAINADRQQGLVVSGNEVQNVVNATNTSSTPFGGIRLLDFKDGICFNNKVHDLAYTGTSTPKIYGIAITSTTFTTVGNPSNAQVYNNIVYKINSTGTSSVWNLTGILASAGYGDRFYYNSVHLTGQLANTSSGLAAAFANGDGNITSVGTNIDVRNNSFSITGSSAIAGGNFWAYYTGATTLAGSTLNYNDLYCAATNVTNNVGRFNGVNSTTLATWQVATGQEANSISADPLYNSASNLVPQLGSPLVAAATPIGGITKLHVM
ncbi:MAG: right-handed parallel beta-helix repeat-containing protein [Chitinophagaceae bacterium]|nr:right-handed parallel beta-helix repeat-containing protein [Chitinophagaceae bacterium]